MAKALPAILLMQYGTCTGGHRPYMCDSLLRPLTLCMQVLITHQTKQDATKRYTSQDGTGSPDNPNDCDKDTNYNEEHGHRKEYAGVV